MKQPLPELLCPAGSPEALDAAIEGGADAVYLGGAAFNARMNAKNFGGDALRSAVLRAHAYGVKIYLTLNTLVTDRELPAFVDAARDAYRAGVDALIIADTGGAAAVRRVLPELELHASTQMSGHNAAMAKELKNFGYSRMVIARETCAADIARAVKDSPLEIEVFIHGALCVSHSGQCLFSSLVGGRSGNRGECAQPCRLPYGCTECTGSKKASAYPLSLRDLCLAQYVPELIDAGVSSLKIEGRMKSPEYVRDVTRVWRKLLDERRAATPEEMKTLAGIFSRGGFTDGYYRSRIGHSMLGVRSEGDKDSSRSLEPFRGLTRKIPLDFAATLRVGEPASLTVSDGIRSVTVTGAVPDAAVNAPLSRENVEKNLSKTGGTPYAVRDLALTMDDRLMIPISSLNELRRAALACFDAQTADPCVEKRIGIAAKRVYVMQKAKKADRAPERTARFYRTSQITQTARKFFDKIYLPLDRAVTDADALRLIDGVVLPPVIFDSAAPAAAEMLKKAAAAGVRYALVGNIGHLSLVRGAGLLPVGDFRLNITNSESMLRVTELGIPSAILSPELTLPQARDIAGDTSLIVYGRIPLMTLEKCVTREFADCRACDAGTVYLRDRRGVEFPILREWEHRNVIFNSIPTNLSDRGQDLDRAKIVSRHFLFSVESPCEVDEVIRAFESGSALPYPVRRI